MNAEPNKQPNKQMLLTTSEILAAVAASPGWSFHAVQKKEGVDSVVPPECPAMRCECLQCCVSRAHVGSHVASKQWQTRGLPRAEDGATA